MKRRSDKNQYTYPPPPPDYGDLPPPPRHRFVYDPTLDQDRNNNPNYYGSYKNRECYPDSLLAARLTNSARSSLASLSRSFSRQSHSRMGYDETQPQNAPLAPPVAADTRNHDDRYGFPNHPGYRPKRNTNNIFLYILAVFLPPVPVFLKTGCGIQLLLNVILWMLCWIPGVLHSFYVIATYNDF